MILAVESLSKSFGATAVFSEVSLSLRAGEFVALLGESGVGKSTLLNCIAGLDEADTGRIAIDGVEIGALGADDRARLRRRKLGFVFQAFHVLPHLSVAENVGLPLRLLPRAPGHGPAADRDRVATLLGEVGLEGLGQRLPAQLSGGQLQRVAIARALVHRPALILADEPTGNLDPTTAARVMDLLLAQTRASGTAGLLVTHSQAAASRADRVLRLTPRGVVEDALAAPGDPLATR